VRVGAEVDVRGVQVGDVDQQQRPRTVGDLGQELPLGQLLVGPGQQRRDVLQRQRQRQRERQLVLGDPDVLGEDGERVPGPGHRQQMPGVPCTGPGEGDVLADQG
jgi:hypothetical protein